MTEEKLIKYLDKRFENIDKRFNAIDQKFEDQSRDLKDYTDSRIAASERRVTKEIIEAVGDLIDRGIHPQLDELDRRVTRLERKLA